MAYQPGQQFGRYRIVDRLGTGGSATTYLAQDTHFRDKQVVLELLPPEMQLFTSEVGNLLLDLPHSNILRLLDFGKQDETSFIVTEYVPGGSLRQRHPRGRVVPFQEVVSYAKQAASALQVMHNQGLVHRDVKPENMLLNEKQQVLLADFGLTILASSQEEPVAGTPLYMAPEQLLGRATPASDQYALAGVVYEWLTGQLPFQGSMLELIQKHSYEPVPPMPRSLGIPTEVEAVVQKALAKRPEDRYPKVLDFADALDHASQPYGSAFSAGFSPLPGYPAQAFAQSFPPPEHTYRSTQGFAESPAAFNDNLFDDDGEEEVYVRSSSDEAEDMVEETKNQPTQLSLFALARAFLEKDESARVGKTYTLEVGIGNRGLDPYRNAPFTLLVQDPTQPILFHVIFHASSNIEALDSPFQPLSYDPGNRKAQFITWRFRLRGSGPSEILVNFYRERQWLRMVRLEFDGVGQALPPSVAKG